MNIKIADRLQSTCLVQQGVTNREMDECFLNRKTPFNFGESINPDESNFWFIAATDRGRSLRIEFTFTTKLAHTLALPGKTVIMEQLGKFYEIKNVQCLVISGMEPIDNSV